MVVVWDPQAPKLVRMSKTIPLWDGRNEPSGKTCHLAEWKLGDGRVRRLVSSRRPGTVCIHGRPLFDVVSVPGECRDAGCPQCEYEISVLTNSKEEGR